jgi:predicted amidohydrolase
VRVTVLELPARWAAPAAALADVDARLAAGPSTDLVLLPEASLTGYLSPEGASDLAPFAEPLSGRTARALSDLAARHRVHLVGPLVEAEGEHVYNAMIGFRPDGARFLHYRKRHPWYPERWATPGEAPYPLVRVGELSVLCAICFDVHFLASDGTAALRRADLLLFPSAWVDDGPEDARAPHLAELARTHKVAIANANWGPGEPRVRGQGGSRIVDASGFEIARAAACGRADAVLGPR